MKDKITTIMNVNENEIRVMRIDNEDYISLTDLARYKNSDDPSDVIKKWLSNYDTIEFLGLWEELSNEDFYKSKTDIEESLGNFMSKTVKLTDIKNEYFTPKLYSCESKNIKTPKSAYIEKCAPFRTMKVRSSVIFVFCASVKVFL